MTPQQCLVLILPFISLWHQPDPIGVHRWFITRSEYEMELQAAIKAVRQVSVVTEAVRKSLANISVSKDDKYDYSLMHP